MLDELCSVGSLISSAKRDCGESNGWRLARLQLASRW